MRRLVGTVGEGGNHRKQHDQSAQRHAAHGCLPEEKGSVRRRILVARAPAGQGNDLSRLDLLRTYRRASLATRRTTLLDLRTRPRRMPMDVSRREFLVSGTSAAGATMLAQAVTQPALA